MTNQAPAVAAEVTARAFPLDRFVIAAIDDNSARPSLRADLIRRGFDGNSYTLERVLTGRKKARTIFVNRGAASGEYF